MFIGKDGLRDPIDDEDMNGSFSYFWQKRETTINGYKDETGREKKRNSLYLSKKIMSFGICWFIIHIIVTFIYRIFWFFFKTRMEMQQGILNSPLSFCVDREV